MGRPKKNPDSPSRRFLTPEQHAAQPLTVPCACGCGTMLPPLNRMGKPSVWVVGHHMRWKKPSEETARKLADAVAASWTRRTGLKERPRRRYMTKERYDAQPLTVPCACGCGTMLPTLNKLGLPSKFVKGHDKRGKPRSPETRQKMSVTRQTRLRAKRGVAPIQYWNRFEDPRYRALRKEVLARDNYTCIVCKMVAAKDGRGLYVDHILEWAKNESERYNPDNCQTLCYKCHCDRHGFKVAKFGTLSPPQPCACGCGNLTKPGRTYLNGHHNKGKIMPQETKDKISRSKTTRHPQPCACGCGQLAPVGRKYAFGCKQKPSGAAIKGALSEESRARLCQPKSEEARSHMRGPKSEAHRAALSEAARRQWAKRKAADPSSG